MVYAKRQCNRATIYMNKKFTLYIGFSYLTRVGNITEESIEVT